MGNRERVDGGEGRGEEEGESGNRERVDGEGGRGEEKRRNGKRQPRQVF